MSPSCGKESVTNPYTCTYRQTILTFRQFAIMMLVLLLTTLLTVEKIAVENETPAFAGSSVNENAMAQIPVVGSKTRPLPTADSGTESIAAIQPNGDVEHIMLTKSQYEELKAGGTIKLGRNVRLRAKAVSP